MEIFAESLTLAYTWLTSELTLQTSLPTNVYAGPDTLTLKNPQGGSPPSEVWHRPLGC